MVYVNDNSSILDRNGMYTVTNNATTKLYKSLRGRSSEFYRGAFFEG